MSDRSEIIRHPANILGELQVISLKIDTLIYRLKELREELDQVSLINYQMWGSPAPHEDFPKRGRQ